MQKCLGIYIEENIIKYAKVSKDRDDVKIESFGMRFYDNLSAEIKQIIEETFSFNTPISVNLANEKYLYFDIFALLSKKDIEKTVETEFETFCEEKKYNKNAFESRYALMTNAQEKEKIRAMDIYINKIELNRQLQPLDNYRLSRVVPTSIAIGNIARVEKQENQLIVNMEESTTITTIINQNIYDIETLDIGSKEVLGNINKIENSYSKAYEICKNTTIYTAEMEETENDQEYLQYIVPIIFEIAQRVQEIVNEDWKDIKKVYLTGTLATINNIDLYFQEFLSDVECEVLKPKFLKNATKVNIKDYIEVNSAIALAANGVGEGVQEFNFQKANKSEKIKKMLNTDLSFNSGSKGGSFSLKGKLVGSEVWLARGSIALLLILIIYIVFSTVLQNGMLKKATEIRGLTSEQTAQIALVDSNNNSLNSKKEKYDSLVKDLEDIDKKTSDIAASKNLIPNLLNQIMFVVPEKVQVISIENTTDKNMTIQAKSPDYEQLGYFIATIKTKGILKNVVSSTGSKLGDSVTVTIEGELP